VQPYLKKCFEGIDVLQFDKEEVITGMVSAEKEIFPLSGHIVPADAKVCTESSSLRYWWKQVHVQILFEILWKIFRYCPLSVHKY
jgi:hypothetical protein